jgi:ABC-type phosphate/phosphonate transport system ATPase subunit
MATIDFEHIDKIYPGGSQAIFDYSLTVADGELVAFVGPRTARCASVAKPSTLCRRNSATWRWCFRTTRSIRT